MAKKVTIYTTPTCPYCQLAKDFFKENKVKYEEVNVAENRKALEEMIEKSGQMGVPVIEIEGTIIIGFNKKAMKEALGT